MKSILETSVYLLVASLICYIGIDFISTNMRVSKINEVTQYMQDYIEVYGEAEVMEDGSYLLDENTFSVIRQKAQQNNMMVSYEYMSKTNEYVYYDLQITYDLKMSIFRLRKSYANNSIVRVYV